MVSTFSESGPSTGALLPLSPPWKRILLSSSAGSWRLSVDGMVTGGTPLVQMPWSSPLLPLRLLTTLHLQRLLGLRRILDQEVQLSTPSMAPDPHHLGIRWFRQSGPPHRAHAPRRWAYRHALCRRAYRHAPHHWALGHAPHRWAYRPTPRRRALSHAPCCRALGHTPRCWAYGHAPPRWAACSVLSVHCRRHHANRSHSSRSCTRDQRYS